jgi:hypothetical protein
MLELFQKPVHKHRRYLLASLAILIAAWGGYVGWQHRATAKIAAPTASVRIDVGHHFRSKSAGRSD